MPVKSLWATCALALMLAGCAVSESSVEPPVRVSVYAAGSLREAMGAITDDYEKRSGQKIDLTFGASGLLRQRIEQGEGAHVFASADTDHPQRLAARGGWQTPRVFARNSLCALTAPHIQTVSSGLLDVLLKAEVRVGTSTPQSDPSGDYTWMLFRKADVLRPGAYARLDAKALKLTGAADSPKPPAGRGTYAWLMDEGRADVFLTYCTNAVLARREVPGLGIVPVPDDLQVGAAYGLTIRTDAPDVARRFVDHVLSGSGQAILASYGFGRP